MKIATRAHQTLLVTVLVGLVTSCASYTTKTSGALRDFRMGRFVSSQEDFLDTERTGSAFLSGAEAGTAALTAGDWDTAIEHFQRAVAAAEDLDGRGIAGVDSLAEGLASWVLNDTTQAYHGEGFERVYVHACLALAYLAKGQLDSVYVEARLANQLLETEEELYDADYGAGGLGHFISGIAYELIGEPDQAYVDYVRMAEKDVGTGLAGPALLRLGEALRREDDLPRWRERFGTAIERPANAASVVVIAGVGLAPYKVEGTFWLPTDDGVFALAVPSYQLRPQGVWDLRLSERVSGVSVLTDALERVDEVGPANLEDRIAWTAVKSGTRGLIKRGITRNLEKDHGSAGRLIGDLFAIATERADLRSWTTLPASWQAARLWVEPGEVDLELEAVGGEVVDLGRYALDPGETMIVLARTVDARLYAHAIGGARLASVDEAQTNGGADVLAGGTAASTTGVDPR